jgi:hypothetical protein
MNPSHTFEATSNKPESFLTKLTVTDSAGGTHTVEQLISLNNTPPEVTITGFADGDLYSTTGSTEIPLEAIVSDAEHGPEALSYAWQVFFHHNTHYHPEPLDTIKRSSAVILGEGCTDETFWYRIGLTVTDGAGLATYREGELFPYCGTAQTEFDSLMLSNGPAGVQIEWTTLQETPGTTFFVQRSDDKQRYTTLGEVAPTGSGSTYTFLDPDLSWGKRAYRIMTQDLSTGFSDYSKVGEIEFSSKGSIALFPNPVTEFLQVDFEEVNGSASLTLYDLPGRTVFERRWPGSGTDVSRRISLSSLAPGTYIYHLNDGRQIMVGKLVKDAF